MSVWRGTRRLAALGSGRGWTPSGLSITSSISKSRSKVGANQRRMASSTSSASSNLEDYSQETVTFLNKVLTAAIDGALIQGTKLDSRVIDFKHPHELEELLKLPISDSGCSNDVILDLCRQTVAYSVRTAHPRFFNQLYTGPNPYGLAAAYTVETLNTNQHTFEVAPVLQVVENHIIKELGKLVGYAENETDGVFLPGGSMSNMVGFHAARHKYNPEIKEKGIFGMKRLVMYTSEECHYSIKKGAIFLGLGSDSVVVIKTDSRGRMLAEDLEKKIQETKDQGAVPYLVNATSGTTLIGAFDPLDSLADVCQKHNLWLHVDICWGTGVLFSKKHKHLVKGIERSDSVAFSLHKMMGVPMQCNAVVLRDKTRKLLQESNSTKVHYLFQEDKFYDTAYDIGFKTIQCGRKGDAFKIWLAWKALGHDGMAKRVDRFFDLAELFTDKVRAREGFQLVFPEYEYVNISFWYIPPSMRGQERTKEWWERLGNVAPKIKEGMSQAGSMLIGYNPLDVKDYVNFFRIIIANPLTSEKDLDFVLDEIDRLGKGL